MTQQETFDTVARHLLKQGNRSMEETPCGRWVCAYRGFNGSKCAAGCLIPDSEYHGGLEGYAVGIDSSPVTVIIEKAGHDVGLVRRLQVIHDNTDASLWGEALGHIADEFLLKRFAPGAECT